MNSSIVLHNVSSGKILLVNPESISRVSPVRGINEREAKVVFTDGEEITVSESFNTIKENLEKGK